MPATGTAAPCYIPHVEGGPVSWSVMQERDRSRTYRVTYKVHIDHTEQGPFTAINAGGLPEVGTIWNDCPDPAIANLDIWAYFTAERTATPWKSDKPYDNQYMAVECVATTKPRQDCLAEGTDNPLSVADRIRIETVNYQKEATEDRFGNLLVNAAFEQFRGHQVEFDNHRLRVYIEQNSATLDLNLVQSLMHHLNDAPLWGFDARQIKLSHFEADPKYYTNCTKYWLRKFVFDIADDFDRCLLQEGTKALRGKWDKNPASANYGQYVLGSNIEGIIIVPVNPLSPRDFIRYQDWNGQPTRSILTSSGRPYDPIYGNLTGAVTAATNATPIQVTFVDHGLVTNDVIVVTGCTGNTAANGTWTVQVLNFDTFLLVGSVGNGAYTGGGTWTFTSEPGQVCIEEYPNGNLLLLGIPLSLD